MSKIDAEASGHGIPAALPDATAGRDWEMIRARLASAMRRLEAQEGALRKALKANRKTQDMLVVCIPLATRP